jgi:hypothetical protein
MNSSSAIAFPMRSRIGNLSAFSTPTGDLSSRILRQRTQSSNSSDHSVRGELNNRHIKWQAENEALQGPFNNPQTCDHDLIAQRTRLLNDYLNFLDTPEVMAVLPPANRLRSAAIREFIYFLFRELNASNHSPTCFSSNSDSELPCVVIECKTYLDKTMLEGSSTAAEQLKVRNPNALYLVVSEWLKLTENINLRKFKVDQIYVLRKQKNTDREYRYLPGYQKNPVHEDVVAHLFNAVRTHLTSNWEGGIPQGLERGFLL